MKWIAALLLIVNVAVYLVASGRQISETGQNSNNVPDVNKEGMLLLSETSIKSSGIAESTTGVSLDPIEGEELAEDDQLPSALIQTEDSISESELTQLEVAEAQPAATQMCYRIGPFKKENSWAFAQTWMDENSVQYNHITSDSRELRAVRVYLGPFNSESATDAEVQKLKSKALDHFVYKVENGLIRISLGYFTQEELADKFLSYLDSIGIEAKSQPEYRKLGPHNWLEIPVENINQSQLVQRDWQESSVNISKIQC